MAKKNAKERVTANHNVIFCLFLANKKVDNVSHTYLLDYSLGYSLGYSLERKGAQRPSPLNVFNARC